MYCIILYLFDLEMNHKPSYLFLGQTFNFFFFFVSLKIDHTLCMVLSRHGKLKSNIGLPI